MGVQKVQIDRNPDGGVRTAPIIPRNTPQVLGMTKAAYQLETILKIETTPAHTVLIENKQW